MTRLVRTLRASTLGLVFSAAAACDVAGTGPSSTEPGPAQAEGVDPSLVLASRGGGSHPAPGTTAMLGRGFDSLSGEVLGDCVARTKTMSFAGATEQPGATSDLVVRYARTREELASSLGVSGEASASFGFFSGSARASWAHRDEIATDTTFLVISNQVVNNTESLETYQLSDAAEKALREGGSAAFYRMCGDQFIAARVTGGSLQVVVEIRNTSKSLMKEMSAGAGIKAWVFSASGEITSAAKSALEKEDIDIQVFQDGGLEYPSGLGDLVSYAYRFRGSVTGANSKHAAPIAFVTAPYSVVSSDASINVPSLTQQRRKLTELAVWHGDAKARRRDLIDAQSEPGTCKDRTARFEAAIGDVEQVMQTIAVDAQACVEAPLKSCGVTRARRMPRDAHAALISQCTGKAPVNQRELDEKRAAEKRLAETEAELREAKKGDTGGSPCAVWEVRSVKPKFGNAAAWVLVTASASAGGTLQAKEERKLFEDSGWAINPALRLPTGAQFVVHGKVNYSTGCGLFDGPCQKGDKIVSSHVMKLGQTIPNGTVEGDQFTLAFECVESAGGRRVAPRVRPTKPKTPPVIER